MAVTDKTRKLLWGRSGNRCAFCRAVLSVDATEADAESVIGDECHVISAKPNGPRHDGAFPSELIDTYENLILLCRTHHKLVDDQWHTFTADVVRKMKADHEALVDAALRDTDVQMTESVLRRQLRDSRMERCGPVLTAVDDELALLRSWCVWLGNRNYLQLVLTRPPEFASSAFVAAVDQARKIAPSVYASLKQARIELNMLTHVISELHSRYQQHVAAPVLIRIDKTEEYLSTSVSALTFAERAADQLQSSRTDILAYLQS